jgi:hypothetical protein
MSTRPVKVFNAFDMQFSSNHVDLLHMQETLDYCEVRFRCILLAFSHASISKQRNIQRALHKELVRYTFTNHLKVE